MINGDNLSDYNYQDLVITQELNIESGDPLTLQLIDFIESINHGRNPSVDVNAGMSAVKTAERIILELKDKLGFKIISKNNIEDTEIDILRDDVFRSLISLGINKIDVERVIKEMINDDQFNGKLEIVIKKALSRL